MNIRRNVCLRIGVNKLQKETVRTGDQLSWSSACFTCTKLEVQSPALDTVIHAYNLSTQQVEAETSEVPGQPGLHKT